MLQEYKVILPTGFETTMLMTEEYKDMFYPDAMLVRLHDIEPLAHHFVLNFALDNRLKTQALD